MTGKLIIVEGLDGSGKSTQIEMLKTRLESEGHDVILVREPGGTELGEEIRELVKGYRGGNDNTALANLFLFNAGRAQLHERIIRPALAEGKIVLQDRSKFSSMSYQGAGDGLDMTMLETLCEIAVAGTEPDLVLFVDVTPEERLARIGGRGEATDAFEQNDDDYFVRARAKFHDLAKNDPNTWSVINGEGSVDDIADDIWSETAKIWQVV